MSIRYPSIVEAEVLPSALGSTDHGDRLTDLVPTLAQYDAIVSQCNGVNVSFFASHVRPPVIESVRQDRARAEDGRHDHHENLAVLADAERFATELAVDLHGGDGHLIRPKYGRPFVGPATLLRSA